MEVLQPYRQMLGILGIPVSPLVSPSFTQFHPVSPKNPEKVGQVRVLDPKEPSKTLYLDVLGPSSSFPLIFLTKIWMKPSFTPGFTQFHPGFTQFHLGSGSVQSQKHGQSPLLDINQCSETLYLNVLGHSRSLPAFCQSATPHFHPVSPSFTQFHPVSPIFTHFHPFSPIFTQKSRKSWSGPTFGPETSV